MKFVNRKQELEILNKKLNLFLSGKWQNTSHLAFLGLRRTGKTFLIKHFFNSLGNVKGCISVFIDLSKYSENIKFLCDGILNELAKSYNKTYEGIDLDYFFVSFSKGNFNLSYLNYKKQNDNFNIFNSFLKLLTIISKKYKLIIAFDEFQEILNFNKIDGLKNIDSIFRSELQNQECIFYIITGSYPSILRDLIQNPKRKLYSHFDIFDIGNFDKNSALKLINLHNSHLNNAQKIGLYKSCSGNPYLINLILEKVNHSLLGDFAQNLRYLLFDKKGAIYTYYEYILEDSLGKIQNSIVIKAILKEIALSSYGLSLKELSDHTGYYPQKILFGIKQLLKIDIIYQGIDKKWRFIDLLFQYFVAYCLGGLENFEFEKNSYYKNSVDSLQNKLDLALSELGKSKEFELYYNIKEFQGSNWKGIKLPKFKVIKKNYYTEYGDEIDLYCETYKGKKWIFELKYKTKNIGNKEVKDLISKFKADKFVYLSKNGFTNGVLNEYNNSKNVYLITL